MEAAAISETQIKVGAKRNLICKLATELEVENNRGVKHFLASGKGQMPMSLSALGSK